MSCSMHQGWSWADVERHVQRLIAERRKAEVERDAAIREAELAAAKVKRIDELFSGGPDTACRTVWQDGIECVSVPIADLCRALDGPDA